MGHSPSIRLEEVFSSIESELDDVYTDGLISAAIYNKKTPKRFLLNAINQADIHICLNMKIKSFVFVYVPSGQKTVFFSRQSEHQKDVIDQYAAILTDDGGQYAHLIGNTNYLDIVSCDSEIALAFGEIPISKAATAIPLWNAEAQDVFSNIEDYQYNPSPWVTYYSDVIKTTHRFYVDARERKMTLDESFSEDKWILLHAQIAPVSLEITEISKSDLDDYEIRAPYYAKNWLINRAITHILPNRAASEGGYFDMEAKFRAEAIADQPSEGNVILPGNEMGGNYESCFNDF